jgi:prepilin-type N-terminal cleavage/methylation domain-containing protein
MKKVEEKKNGRRYVFTLIELLLVISIIAILAALLLPALTRAKTVARQSLCLSNMKQVGQGVFLYTDDFNEYFPSIHIPATLTGLGPTAGLKILASAGFPLWAFCPMAATLWERPD